MAVDITLLNSNSLENIQTNFDRVEVAFEEVLGRGGDLPNSMNADLDMDSNDIINIKSIDTEVLYIDGVPVSPSDIGFLAPNTVGTDQIIDLAVTEDKLATNSVTSTKIADGSIIEPKHATGGVSTRALADESATLAKIGDDAKADFRLVDPNGPRIPVGYYDAFSVQIVGVREIAMGGFRYKGRYKVGRAPVFSVPAYQTGTERNIVSLGDGVSTPGNLFAEAYHSKQSWYAMFAAANDGDATADLGFMPFLRVGSIAGNVVTLNQCGENERSIVGKTYQFTTNALAGCDVLVINETLNSRGNAFSGRLTTVTANTQTTVTLADVGTMGEYDYFLIAPPGYDHYCYLNTILMDTGEVRNIADDGRYVGTRGSENTQASISGAGPGPTMMPFDGHISPLATAVKFVHNESVASSTAGSGTVRWGTDQSNHDIDEFVYAKDSASSQAYTFSFPPIPFSFHPRLWFYHSNTLNIAANTRKVNIRGWVES